MVWLHAALLPPHIQRCACQVEWRLLIALWSECELQYMLSSYLQPAVQSITPLCPVHARICFQLNIHIYIYLSNLSTFSSQQNPFPVSCLFWPSLSAYWQKVIIINVAPPHSALRGVKMQLHLFLDCFSPGLPGKYYSLIPTKPIFWFFPTFSLLHVCIQCQHLRPNARWTDGRLHPYSFTGYLMSLM